MSQQNIPGATWQATWINLINQLNFEYLQKNFMQSWNITVILYAWLPIECKADCKKRYDEIAATIQKNNQSSEDNYQDTVNAINRANSFYLQKTIPLFSSEIASSLETRKWIHKEAGYSGVDANKELEDL